MAKLFEPTNPVFQVSLWEFLEPIGGSLLGEFEKLAVDPVRPTSDRVGAANSFVYFSDENSARLARLLTEVEPPEYKILFEPFCRIANEQSLNILCEMAARQPGENWQAEQRVQLGKQRAAAAFGLLRLGDLEAATTALRYDTDPEAVTQFVHRWRASGVTANDLLALFKRLDTRRGSLDEDRSKIDDSAFYATLLALGDAPTNELGDNAEPVVDRLSELYRADPSSAVHSACGWLLNRWGKKEIVAQIDQNAVPYDPTGHREWYVEEIRLPEDDADGGNHTESSLYFTFILFEPGESIMGSALGEPDKSPRRVTLSHRIGVLDREITWAHFVPFDNGTHRAAWSSQFASQLSRLAKELTASDPAFGINWFESVAYCRWLTVRAGMLESDHCYSSEPLADNANRDTGWVDLPDETPWPVDLDQRGFRLLTETEWEYVCRSGTNGPYSFGSDATMLEHYGWYVENSLDWSQPVGQMRPNPRGLFDIHGNMYEWCYDCYAEFNADIEKDPVGPSQGSDRVLRGGGWDSNAGNCRSSFRNTYAPSHRINNLGFRVSRSLTSPASLESE